MEEKDAIFNESALQIQRLNNDLIEAKEHKKKGRLRNYKFMLDVIEDELWCDADDLDKEVNEKSEKYTSKLIQVNKEIDLSILSFNLISFYRLLREKERLLRRIQQECGKGTSYRSMDDN